MFKVNDRSTRCHSDVNMSMPDRIHCLNLNLSRCVRVRSRSPVTFTIKLYVTTAKCFLPLPIFCHKELHLRYCIGLELNLVTWSKKILKGIGAPPMIDCNFGEIEKLPLLDALKIHFHSRANGNSFTKKTWL